MFDLMIWVVLIPTAVMAAKFWGQVFTYLLRNKRSIAERMRRVRAALAEQSGNDH